MKKGCCPGFTVWGTMFVVVDMDDDDDYEAMCRCLQTEQGSGWQWHHLASHICILYCTFKFW